MIHANDLQRILTLLEQQQVALASQSRDAVDRLEHINTELQTLLQRLLPLTGGRMPSQPLPADSATQARIHQLLNDNRHIMIRLSDNNQRALKVLFNTEPLVYSR
ncbi:MAG: hypothetical protein Q4D91_01695 [Lautropia sp.]|nr:hypothetical protein [Lautropia sp.]